MDNKSKLYKAIENNDLESIKYLLEQGANLQAENDQALRLAAENGHLKVVKHLVEQGADSDKISSENLNKLLTSHDLQFKKITPRLSSSLLKINLVKKPYQASTRKEILSKYKKQVLSSLVILMYRLYYRPSGPGFFRAIEQF